MSINENNNASSANNETFSEEKKSFWQRTKEAFNAFFSLATLRKFWQFLFLLVIGLFGGAVATATAVVAGHFLGTAAAVFTYVLMLFAFWMFLTSKKAYVARAEAWFMHQFDKAVLWWIVRREVKAAEAEFKKAEGDGGLGDMPAAA